MTGESYLVYQFDYENAIQIIKEFKVRLQDAGIVHYYHGTHVKGIFYQYCRSWDLMQL